MGNTKHIETPAEIGIITKIAFSPIKGATMIETTDALLRTSGLEVANVKDREFMVVEANHEDNVHKFITQREKPRLALIRQELYNDSLKLTWAGFDPISINLNDRYGEELYVQLHKREITIGIDAGKEIERWLTEHLEAPAKLVRAPRELERAASQKYVQNDTVLTYPDSYPIHWFTEQSLAELSKRTFKLSGKESEEEMGKREISWERLRPNFIIKITNPNLPNQIEHMVNEGIIGEIPGIPFMDPKPCDRCSVTMVDPKTGEILKDSMLLKALAQYQIWETPDNKRKTIFGEKMLPMGNCKVSWGNPIVMTSVRDPPLKIHGAKE
ncbi:MAG: MOSC N-terminal beta barrel domain-containing protein [Candidatus Micrarchaeaceae archaeon]|jgi:uncharacterized protein